MPVLYGDFLAPKGELDLKVLGLSVEDVEGYIAAAADESLLDSATDATIRAYVYWRAYSHTYQTAVLGPTSESTGSYRVSYSPAMLGYLRSEMKRWGDEMVKLEPSTKALLKPDGNAKTKTVDVEFTF